MRKRDWVPLLFLFVAAALLLLDRGGGLSSPKAWLSRWAASGEMALSRLLANIGNARVFFQDLDELRADNEMLRQRVEDLTVELAALGEVVAENEVLRRELGFVQTQGVLGLRGADVTGRVAVAEPGNLIRAIHVDFGRNAGLLPDMPVVTGRGLVGRVIEVEGAVSEVLLITDSRSSVAALIQRTRTAGIVRGQVDGSLVMDGIARDADVQVGDIVLTSGLGGVFPKGIVIGQVSQVLHSDTAMFLKAVVSPSVDLSSLEVVLVVTSPQAVRSEPGDGP